MINSKKEWRPQASIASSLLLAAVVAIELGCGSGASAGATCAGHSDCQTIYQCSNQVCVPRCEQNAACGDGYQCTQNGICDPVQSLIGDVCASEWDCGLGQSCRVDNSDFDGDNKLGATCQLQGSGFNVGTQCSLDDECRSGLCAIGVCSQLCEADIDCPALTGCTLIPRETDGGQALFSGCLQDRGVLKFSVAMTSPAQRLMIPVPEAARSFALVSSVEDTIHFVGATRVVAPSEQVLFNGTRSFEEEGTSAIRYSRQKRLSTLLVPNRDTLALETGFYQIDIEASLPPSLPGTATPEVTVFYKLDDRSLLDLHFYFLDLEDHPCAGKFGVAEMSAAYVAKSDTFQNDYLDSIRDILGNGDIQVGEVTYTDIDRADLDGIVGDNLHRLFRLSTNETGIAVFFVRSLSPDGVQAQIGGTPGPPRSPGTARSGIAVSADTLCYRSWQSLARITGHSIAGQMGLWNNRDPQGVPDPISDSDSTESNSSQNNLMFFGEFGGTELSEGQKKILKLYPGLR